MRAFGKALLLLIFVAATSVATAADDLAKLKAALAERFAAYQSIRVEFTFAGRDPELPSVKVGSQCIWERVPGRERFEQTDMFGRDSTSLAVFDGVRTTSVWFPGPQTGEDPRYEGAVVTGYARLYKGSLSYDDSMSNAAAITFGLICSETGSSLLELLDNCDTTALSPAEVNGRQCLVWQVSGSMRSSGTFQGRLAVDSESDWMPVMFDVERHHPADGTVFRHAWNVLDTMAVHDDSTGLDIRVPKVTHFVEYSDGNVKGSPTVFDVQKFQLGFRDSAGRFQVAIPPGFRIVDETSAKTKVFVSGGPQAEKIALAEIAANANRKNQNINSVTVNASQPEGTSWSLWLYLGSAVLALGSLYVRRM